MPEGAGRRAKDVTAGDASPAATPGPGNEPGAAQALVEPVRLVGAIAAV